VSPALHNEELIEEGEENFVDVFHLQNLQRTFSRSILILSVGLSYFITNCIELHLNCKYGCFPPWESSNDFFKGILIRSVQLSYSIVNCFELDLDMAKF